MTKLPESALKAWETREGPIVLATVDKEGTPNIIYAGCVKMVNEETFVVADNYFHKTRANILAGSAGSLLFLTNDQKKSYQIKGMLSYETEGALFADMKTLNLKHPGHAVVVLHVEMVFFGAEQVA